MRDTTKSYRWEKVKAIGLLMKVFVFYLLHSWAYLIKVRLTINWKRVCVCCFSNSIETMIKIIDVFFINNRQHVLFIYSIRLVCHCCLFSLMLFCEWATHKWIRNHENLILLSIGRLSIECDWSRVWYARHRNNGHEIIYFDPNTAADMAFIYSANVSVNHQLLTSHLHA